MWDLLPVGTLSARLCVCGIYYLSVLLVPEYLYVGSITCRYSWCQSMCMWDLLPVDTLSARVCVCGIYYLSILLVPEYLNCMWDLLPVGTLSARAAERLGSSYRTDLCVLVYLHIVIQL